jgi:hypothetical protein
MFVESGFFVDTFLGHYGTKQFALILFLSKMVTNKHDYCSLKRKRILEHYQHSNPS